LLWDIVYDGASRRPVFFEAALDHGVMEVPLDPPGLRAAGGTQ
jgi:hypothetical protein